ncbi:MAG TPA: GNAT family N-acetyltransferase [Bradyrhizobium sp.]|nr:GNAT family N-acetyltransferase [Bradyrhizobium sp.]
MASVQSGDWSERTAEPLVCVTEIIVFLVSPKAAKDLAMPGARIANKDDLQSQLALFQSSNVSRHAEPQEIAERIWRQTVDRDGLFVLVSEADNHIVSTCTLITVPNLLRGGRQYGFIENVVTHPDYQPRGHGRAVIGAALNEAWRQDCYHVLLQSGKADPRVHRFYEGCGFEPGLRTAYAAPRPTGSAQ